MSIIIKGIDLPKEGELHLIITNNGIICGAEYPKKIKHAYPLNLDVEAIQIPKGHGRLIDANKLEAMMYHEAFEIDSDMQKWDSGCWIRYKVFENCMNRLLPDTILEAEAEK